MATLVQPAPPHDAFPGATDPVQGGVEWLEDVLPDAKIWPPPQAYGTFGTIGYIQYDCLPRRAAQRVTALSLIKRLSRAVESEPVNAMTIHC
jgi:hypothetical protein